MTQKSNQTKPILGISDRETVMVDFDNTSFKETKHWAEKILKSHRLGGFVILKSSIYNYHVVFDRPVSWSENMRILAWASLLSQKQKLREYLVMQCIKKSSTLRVSPKNNKPSPRIVFRQGRQNKQISDFLRYRNRIKKFARITSNLFR